ncbi:MAG: response regulator [Propionivibrio sp.]|nr:response regulator [Propionivibrio sp.]
MTTEAKQFKEVTILLVEDDDVDVMGIERALRKLKILNHIVRAKDGLEALELLRDPHAVRRPYVILLDINMPRMNGLEMLAELRNDPRLTSAVVFVLTTSKSDEDKVAAYKQHVAGYIVKSQVGDGFLRIMEMLDHYWRVVELPVED